MPIPLLKPSIQSVYLLLMKKDRALYSGTGIVVMTEVGPTLVTSRQLFTGRYPEVNRRLSPKGMLPNRLKIAHNRLGQIGDWVIREERLYDRQGQKRWVEHPTLTSRANIVALPLTDIFDVEFYPYDLNNSEPDIIAGVTDPVSVIGFPYGLRGGPSFAIWAYGVIASVPVIDQFGLPMFLIDCRTRLGQSGSAVNTHYNDRGVVSSSGNYSIKPPVTRFMGIYSGRIDSRSDLGMVWRVSAIKELVDSLGSILGHDESSTESEQEMKPEQEVESE